MEQQEPETPLRPRALAAACSVGQHQQARAPAEDYLVEVLLPLNHNLHLSAVHLVGHWVRIVHLAPRQALLHSRQAASLLALQDSRRAALPALCSQIWATRPQLPLSLPQRVRHRPRRAHRVEACLEIRQLHPPVAPPTSSPRARIIKTLQQRQHQAVQRPLQHRACSAAGLQHHPQVAVCSQILTVPPKAAQPLPVLPQRLLA